MPVNDLSAVPVFSAWKLLGAAFLVLANGFFVAAEFALVKVRPTRIHALARKGDGRARIVTRMLGDLSLYLSGCQLGITLASLALGWLSESAVAAALLAAAHGLGLDVQAGPWVHVVALLLALTIITIVHMTIGEQAPKVFAIAKAETMALLAARPLFVFTLTLRPFIWLVNVLSNAMVEWAGISGANEHAQGHDVGELRAVLGASNRAGHITTRQQTLGENVLDLTRLEVRHIMLPRVSVVYLSSQMTLKANLDLVAKSHHSRFPLCTRDLDDVRGIIHVRDLFAALQDGRQDIDLESLSRPALVVPDTQRVSKLIVELQRAQRHCAIVVDEYGSAVGMAFLEDALEEIVGPIHDEFDTENPIPWVDESKEGIIEMAGSVPVPDAADILDLDLPADSDTIGGYVTERLGKMPEIGASFELPPFVVTILAASKRRVTRIRFELGSQGAGSKRVSLQNP